MTAATSREHPRKIGWLGTTALAMGGSNQMVFLVGALVVGQGSINGQGTAAVPLLAVGLSWGSFVVGFFIILSMIGRDTADRAMHVQLYDWLPAGQFQLSAHVYGRAGEPCHGCGAPVRRIVQAQRSTFFCARCQKR